MARKIRKRLMSLVLAAVILFTAGCGNSNEGSLPSAENEKKVENGGGDSDIAMGRYEEEETDLSDKLANVRKMKRFSDGRLVITDASSGIWVSDDNGASWENENTKYLEEKLANAYIMDLGVGEDGTLGIIYDDYEEAPSAEGEEDGEDLSGDEEGVSENGEEDLSGDAEGVSESGEDENSEESDSVFDLSPECALVRADGTVVPVSLSLTEDEMYANRIWLTREGRAFITTLGDIIYEVKEDGSSEEFLRAEGRPMLIQFRDNIMLIDGYDFEAPLLYDMEKEEYVEDGVLSDFVKNNGSDRQFNGGSWYDIFYFFGEEELYLAGDRGLYRHAAGQEEMEQLIDGSLSRLGSPKYGIKGMVMLGNDVFLAVFNSGKVVRFTYNPDMPSMPEECLKVYSLEDSYGMRTAISLYQIANPNVRVEYEVGRGEDSGVTREDALKKLNTRIVAGEGPDVLLIDGLPVDSYIEKGLLLDLNEFLEGVFKEEEFFENLVRAFVHEGSVYMVPMQAGFPVMLGREGYVSQMKDLSAVADEMEKMREDYPEKDILGTCSEIALMKIFSVSSEPAWKKENGEINEDAVAEFLTQMKRIYDAQMDGIGQKWVDRFESTSDWYAEEIGENWEYNLGFYGLNTLDYVGEYTRFMAGMTTYPYGYYDITSAAKTEGFEDTVLAPMAGQCSNVFAPDTILGINAASEKKELAEDFLKEFMGKEVQMSLGGFGINKAAFEELLTVDKEELGENNQYGSMAMMDEDGVEVSLDVYYPEEEERKVLKNWMESADTPYMADIVFEQAIFEEGEEYIRGNQSLEETLKEIRNQLAIYMSE